MRESFNACVDALNRLGELHWSLAAPMAVQAGLLVLALAAIDLLLRRRARAIVRYWLWALVLVKLVLPIDLRTPASIGYWVAADRAVSIDAAPAATEVRPATDFAAIPPNATVPSATTPLTLPTTNQVGSTAQRHRAAVAVPTDAKAVAASARTVVSPPALRTLNWQGGLLLVWLAVVAILLSMLARRTWKVRRLMREAARAPSALTEILRESGAIAGMNTARVRLLVTDRLGSPAICGFFRPAILLPRRLIERLDGEQMRLVFVHELVHWKRFDLQVNWLQTILQVVYFYNPAVWLAGWMLRRLREQAVDEAALVALGGEPRRYGSTLLDVAALAPARAEPVLRLIGVVESRTALAARIRRIVARPIPKTARLGIVAGAAIVLLGIALLPMAGGRQPTLVAAPPAEETDDAPAQQSDAAAEPTVAESDPTVEDPSPAVLSGRITDETGGLVTDAEIELRRRGVETVSSKTDQDGRYRFETVEQPGEYQMHIASQRWVGITHFRKLPRVNLSSAGRLVRDFTLKQAAQLEIQVMDQDRQPIGGASVYTKMFSDNSGYVSGHHRTDKTGWVTLGGLEPSAATRIVGVSDDSYAMGRLLVVVDKPGKTTHQITLQKGQAISGKALCTDGKPAATWRVSALPTWWTFGVYPMGATIMPDGSFTLRHVAPDNYNVSVSIPTGEGSSIGKQLLNDVALPLAGQPLMLKVDHPSPGSEVAISGRIRYEGKKLQRGFHASAYPKQGPFASYNCYIKPGQTEFEFTKLPRGVYRITFDSTEIESVVMPTVTAPAKDLEVAINVRGMLQLRGNVVRAGSEKPVGEFRVLVTKLRSLSGPSFVQEKTWHEFHDEAGKFAVDVVGPGIYVATVEAAGLGAKQSDQTKIVDASSPPVHIELGGGTKLTGTVADQRGRPIDGAIVVPLRGPRWAQRVTLARADEPGAVKSVLGAFALSPLAEGQETLKVSHPDYAPTLVGNVTTQQNGSVKPLKIVLGKGVTLRGHVFDQRGRPQSGVTLHIQDGGHYSSRDEEANRLATVVTDAEGYYKVPRLPGVLLHVARSDKWRDMGVVEQMILAEKGVTHTLDFGGPTRITGRLVVNGEPLAGTSIVLSTGSPYSSVFKANGRTDEDGVFALFGLPPGEKTLYYSHDPTKNQWVRATAVKLTRTAGPLGTINGTTGKLTVQCKPISAVETGDVSFSLRQYRPTWTVGNPAGSLLARQSAQDPFVFDQVPLGKYVLVSHYKNHLSRHKIVEIAADKLNPTVDFELPEGTASLTVTYDESFYKPRVLVNLKLWSADGQIVGYNHPGDDGKSRLENVPAGQYRLKRYDTRDAPTLLTIAFDEGEAKTLNVTSELLAKSPRLGFAMIRTFTAGGLPLPGCQVRFDDAGDAPRLQSSQYGRMGFTGQPGRYAATIEYPGYQPLRTTLEVKQVPAGGLLGNDFEVTYRLQNDD